jgi:predicted GH43/DUF377 family glycosyl hydrolase
MKRLLSMLIMSMLFISIALPWTGIGKAVTPPTTEWQRTYGGTGFDNAFSVIQTSDRGYAMTGETSSFGAGSNDFWLVKTDSMGNEQWNRTYGGTNKDFAYCVIQTKDGGFAMAGCTWSFGAGPGDFWLVKTDALGNEQWNKTYGGTSDDDARCVIQTSDGGYAIVGYTYSFADGGNDFWLVKTDENGTMQWSKTYGGGNDDLAYCVVQTSDGGYAVAGTTYSFGAGDHDFWLVKTEADGSMLWNRTYGGTGADWALSVIQTSDRGYTLVGATGSFGAGSNDFWFVKTDTTGNMQWNQTYGGTGDEEAWSVLETRCGGYAIAGETSSFGAGGYDAWLVQTDAEGSVMWNSTYGGTSHDRACSMVQTCNGGYAIAGGTESSGEGSRDFWLIELAQPLPIHWIKYPENPVLNGYLQPWVIYDGNIFKMWCSSSPGLVSYDFRISYFTSSDGINWAFKSIVLEKGEPSSWDDYGVQRPLVQFDGSIYKMWYLGYRSGGFASVGYATSLDGISWIKNTSPVLTPGNNGGWDDWSISDFTVVFNGTFYRMWYGAQRDANGPTATGAATSFDGISWTKYSGNPVLTSTPGNWDSEHVSAGPTVFNGNHYLMWYTGQQREHPASIGLATSEDGFSWTKYEGNPVLSVGPSGSWESEYVQSSCILERDDRLMMWYTAASYHPTETIGIGLAISCSSRHGAAIDILSPQNTTYTTSSVALTFAVDEPTSWIGYSLDNHLNVTISGNTSLNVEDGCHQIVVYANDTFGLMGSSEIVSFAVDTTFHDIAVTSITLSKTVLGQGYPANITTAVNNPGNYTETFIVDFYANTTPIGKSKSITLPEGGSANVIFTWNSASFSKGVYTVSAHAEPVPNEKVLSNNNLVDGTIRVTIPGDVNGDFKVNCKDLAMLLCSYGAKLGSARWDPNCDINGDGKINCIDLAVLLCHYGQHYP